MGIIPEKRKKKKRAMKSLDKETEIVSVLTT